ncbi:hypothetical protein; putative signal peptide [Frankia alni ACN14a]|uniref:Uncharacterized protein n=1 Tax=Frankia alni (strain DSM 45986 / CECT 9034 / ACN14a) TaxID=326424 RepID=Q0RG60_FRAAA|nr:hypothetical protein; putative signal peptide [Frankia alni ACN14a]
MPTPPPLVHRRHIDLLLVSSAICPAGGRAAFTGPFARTSALGRTPRRATFSAELTFARS